MMPTNPNAGYVNEDSYQDLFARRSLYIQFGSYGDELFANNKRLTNCSYAFAKCTAQGTMGENIFGGVSLDKKTDGSTAYYSNELESVAYCFHDCGVTTTLTNNLFKNQPNLTSVAGFVSGGIRNGSTYSTCLNVTGRLEDLSSIFSNNQKLTNVRRFFESTGVTGQIPSGTSAAASPLFAMNEDLTDVKYLFRNAQSVTGYIPVSLFGKCKQLASAKGVFKDCIGLNSTIAGSTDSSEYLFKCFTSDNSCFNSLTDVSELFSGCSNIYSQIPSNLFIYTTAVTNVSSVFRGCGTEDTTANKGVYGEIPANLLATMPNITNVSYLFSGCWKLTPMTYDGDSYSSPVDATGASTLFANNKLINNAAGLFQRTNVYRVPADLFSGVTNLQDVSYMFNFANRSQALLPTTIFDSCRKISNIACFAGESGSSYNTAYSLLTFPTDIFKPYSTTSGVGQEYISNVFCAFRNNNNLTSGEAIDFWNWNNPPTSYAGCYHMCSVTDIDTVPSEYK